VYSIVQFGIDSILYYSKVKKALMSVPALVLDGKAINVNFGAYMADVKASVGTAK
jgi:hypothetical protein